MPEVEMICNRITVIDHGKVVITGTKQEIIEKMGRDKEIDVEFTAGAGELDRFEAAVGALTGVHRCASSADDEAKVCRIFSSENASVMEDIIRLAGENGLTITNIKCLEPSLEEIFLTLTGKELRDGE